MSEAHDPSSRTLPTAHRAATRSATYYLAFAAAWIVGTDMLLHNVGDLAALTRLQTIKGLIFVLATGGLLYALQRYEIARVLRAEATQREERAAATAVANVGRDLIRAFNTPELLTTLCAATVRALGAERSVVFLADDRLDGFVAVAASGVRAEDWEVLRAMPVPRAEFDQLLVPHVEVLEVSRDELPRRLPGSRTAALARRSGLGRALVIAIRERSRLVGVQSVSVVSPGHRFGDIEHRIAAAIARLSALTIHSFQLYEQVERANRLKADFAAAMSHELRTPLNVILGYAGLLLEGEFGPLAGDQNGVVRRIEENGRELLGLVDDTLDLGRLEAGRVPVQLEPVAVDELLSDLMRDAATQARRADVALLLDDVQADVLAVADATKLRIVLHNLVSNALKFTAAGHVRVGATMHEAGVDVFVEDTGVGIPESERAMVFEPFAAGRSPGADHSAVGIGLYIARRLVELMGGRIGIQAVVPSGTRVVVSLPRAPAARSAPARRAAAS